MTASSWIDCYSEYYALLLVNIPLVHIKKDIIVISRAALAQYVTEDISAAVSSIFENTSDDIGVNIQIRYVAAPHRSPAITLAKTNFGLFIPMFVTAEKI